MTTDNQELDRILFRVAGVGAAVRKAGVDPSLIRVAPAYIEAKAALNQYFLDLIGEDYVFERPKEDYIPNTYIQLKAKNELRAELRTKLGQNQ